MTIPSEVYTILGTIVGGGIGFAGTYFTQRNQWKLEREKIWEDRLAKAATDLAAVAHSLCWVTWSAYHDWIDQKTLETYNIEMHTILPRIIGSHIALAAVDEKLGKLTKQFVVDAHTVDDKIGKACIVFEKDEALGLKQLKGLYKEASELDERIFSELPNLARKAKH